MAEVASRIEGLDTDGKAVIKIGASIIKDLNGYVQQRISSEFPTIDFRSAITTNAYMLDDAMFHDLSECGVNEYQITVLGRNMKP
jgi:sulfatase maturation enzyme AslB (radical SAM superfamily)